MSSNRRIDAAAVVLRTAVGIMFISHAALKYFVFTLPGTAKFFASYSFQKNGLLNTITARLDNATNEEYRNHLNYLKDVLPEAGRSFKVVYAVGF